MPPPSPCSYVLSDLVQQVLTAMVETGGQAGLRVVQSYVPTFCYYNPKD